MDRTRSVVVGVLALVLVVVTGVILGRETAAPATTTQAAGGGKLDFFFQEAGYHTANQGGQTLNLYFHYRYDAGLAVSRYPNYLDLRADANKYLDTVDPSRNPYWEILAKTLCTQLKQRFPISAISCQLQVRGNNHPGPAYEPGWHNAIYTIGNIEPLAVPEPG